MDKLLPTNSYKVIRRRCLGFKSEKPGIELTTPGLQGEEVIKSLGLIKIHGVRGGLVVGSRTPERDVGGSNLHPPCCVLEQRHIYSPKSTGNTQEAVAPSRHDRIIVYWDVISLNKTKLFKNTKVIKKIQKAQNTTKAPTETILKSDLYTL